MKSIFFTFFCINCFDIYSQDNHFTQFYSSPLTLNPALTGNFNGMVRIGGNYRQQWDNLVNSNFLYSTPACYTDINFFNRNLSLGLHFLNDHSNNKTFNNLEFSPSLSYHIKFWKMKVSIGFQGHYSQKYLDKTKLDPNFLGTDNSVLDMRSNFNINTGAFAIFKYLNEDLLYYGLAINHLISTKDQFNTNSSLYNTPMKFTVHSGLDLGLSQKLRIVPGMLFTLQNGSSQLNFGSTINYRFNKHYEDNRNCYFAGVWIRSNETTVQAIMPKLGIEYNRMRTFISYDYTVNGLGIENRPNTLELSIQYIFNTPEKKRIDFDCIYTPY